MSLVRYAAALMLCGASVAASATTITGWNTGNVVQVPEALPGTGVSVIYDRDVTGGTAGANTNGTILWRGSPQPGMTVINDDVDLNPNQSFSNCVAAVGAQCEGPFQSDKRVKTVVTNIGAIDMVFDVTADPETNSYRVYQRLINESAFLLGGFTVELGYGIGDSFVASGAGDGLSFDPSVAYGPDNLPSYFQFPFGLFGDASTDQNHSINGFFSLDRAVFGSSFSSDLISASGISSNYTSLFGPSMLNTASVPDGYFWDTDSDPSTDALLMAWYNGSAWEVRREIDPNDPFNAISVAPTLVDENDLIGLGYARAAITDLRNVNMDFSVLVDDSFQGQQFTLRFNTVSGAVPEPSSWAMLIAGFGLVGATMRRRRRSAVSA
jgi:hypothetical protein